MDDWSLELRVVYEDLPSLIEVETRVRAGDWSACSKAYCSPTFLTDDAARLIAWSRDPRGHFQLECGADTGIGWLVLDFYTINGAGHTRCAVTLATGDTSGDPRPAETWRFAVELTTEPGLIERFAEECVALSRDYSRKATLIHLRH
ncbi:MAG: hypothetical protein JNM86_01730 [Phycisphaerae bacterium]|nr:hypothetical protein [Phycisphaerae bacterium]